MNCRLLIWNWGFNMSSFKTKYVWIRFWFSKCATVNTDKIINTPHHYLFTSTINFPYLTIVLLFPYIINSKGSLKNKDFNPWFKLSILLSQKNTYKFINAMFAFWLDLFNSTKKCKLPTEINQTIDWCNKPSD